MSHGDLFQLTPIATSLCTADGRRAIEVNEAYLHLFCVRREDIVGHVPPEADAISKLPQAMVADPLEDEIEIEGKLGSKRLQRSRRTIEIDGVPHMLSTFLDVTKCYRVTKCSRNLTATTLENEQMRELIHNSHEVFWLRDPNTNTMLFVSPSYERMFGRASAALHADAHDWLRAIAADDRDRMRAFTSAPTTVERRADCRLITPNGTVRSIRVKVFPVRDQTGAVVRIAGVAEDITDLLQLEEQVRQVQKMESLGLLAGGVAHDFNNILAVIQCNASLLTETVPQNHPDRELVDEIDHAVHRAASLTRQLLAFSRKQVVVPTSVDLNATVNETRKMLRRMVGEDVIIKTSLEPELSRIRIDPGYLVQILMNLAVNARDAMPAGGTLTITTRHSNHEVTFAVSDTGCGMAEDVKARVFEPFFTTKGLGKGTGLGLSVVHGIVEQAGGRVEIESELDVGTTFRIFMPVDDAPFVSVVALAAARSRGNETLLVVDDDPHVRQSISRMLRMRGYEVYEAGEGPAALELLSDRRTNIDLLITDVVMPGMDGRQLVDEARTRNPSLQVLYISGYTDDAVLRHGVERAEVSVLEKPFTGEALGVRVRQSLDEVFSPRTRAGVRADANAADERAG